MTATRPNESISRGSAEIRERLSEAWSRREALRIVGGGSWLDANRPVRAESILTLDGFTEIVEYEPGDLTLTARAGATLEAIARAAAAHGQWLALDPPGDPARATLGATVATGSYGPLAHHFGTPRDMTLGVEFITGTGVIARGGGRVVKNVAGFDLTRLITGSWGSLGVIAEVTVRLRARPAVDVTLVLSVGETVEQVESLRRALRGLPFIPLAAHWLDGRLAAAIGIESSGSMAVIRIGGNDEAVRAQRAALETLGDAREENDKVWDRLRVAEPASAAVLRLSRLPSEFARTWSDARRMVEQWPGAYRHGDAGRGTVRCVFPLGASDAERGGDLTTIPFDGTRIFERLPAPAWTQVPSSLHSPLEQRIKSAFDPGGILNPGILGEVQ